MDRENNVEYLASYRVLKPGCMPYRAKNMTPEQIIERRAYLRQLLLKTQWGNLPNDALDAVRVRRIPNTDEFLFADEDEYEYLLPTSKLDLSAGAFRKERSMIPFEFKDKEFKDFDWNKYSGHNVGEARELTANFLKEFERFRENGMGLYIYSGTKGSGKTLLASLILNEISRRYAVNTKFVTVLDFIEMTKKGFNDSDGEVKMIYNAAVLVLDDLGVQMSKEWINSSLYQLINHRYNNKLVTIYTSNIKYTDLKIDDRIVDRIDATTYFLSVPEVPVRHQMKQAEKDKLMGEVFKKMAP